MCNLSQGVYENGLKQGMVQGVDQNQIDSLRALMGSLNVNLEQAIQMLNYPMTDKDKYAAALS